MDVNNAGGYTKEKLSYKCFYMHMGFDITDVKFLKFTANRLNPFVVIKEQKQTLPLFRTLWHQGPTGTLHMVSEQKG